MAFRDEILNKALTNCEDCKVLLMKYAEGKLIIRKKVDGSQTLGDLCPSCAINLGIASKEDYSWEVYVERKPVTDVNLGPDNAPNSSGSST